MSVSTLFLYLVFSIILLVILNLVEKRRNNNFYDYVIVANISIIFLAGIFDYYKIVGSIENIFLIVLFAILFNIFYITVILERSILRDNKYNLIKYMITLVSCYLVNIFFINNIDSIFLKPEEFRIILWLFIFGFMYYYLKDFIVLFNKGKKKVSLLNDREYIIMNYAKFRGRYSNIVKVRNRDLENLVYAIMIYENYNRTEILRKFDLFKYQIMHNSGKFGIMQVFRNVPISDIDSIKIVSKKLERLYVEESKKEKKYLITNIIKRYYRKNIFEIEFIYREIVKFRAR